MRARRVIALAGAVPVVAAAALLLVSSLGGGHSGVRINTANGTTSSLAMTSTTSPAAPSSSTGSTSLRSTSPSTAATRQTAPPGLTVTNGDAGRTFTVPVGTVVSVALTGNGPNNGWQSPFSDDQSVLRTDASTNTDPLNGDARGAFTAVAAGESMLHATHTCSGTQCTATIWWARITVVG